MGTAGDCRQWCNIFGCSCDWNYVSNVSSEPQALEAVYRSSRLALTRLAYLLVGDRGEAEDIVQTVFTTRGDTLGGDRRAGGLSPPRGRQPGQRRAPSVLPECGDGVGITASIDEPEVDELWGLVRRLPDRATGRRRAAVLRGPHAGRHRHAVEPSGEHGAFRSSTGVDEAEGGRWGERLRRSRRAGARARPIAAGRVASRSRGDHQRTLLAAHD